MANKVAVQPKLPVEKIQRLIELEAQERKIKAQINLYREELLVMTQQNDVYTLKTGKYTLSRATRITPKVISFNKLKESLEKNEIPYETYETFTPQMSVVFREISRQRPELMDKLDGLDYLKTEYISIRVKGGEK